MSASTPLSESLLGDVRFAFRHFARHRATTALIVAVLALGTGTNTVIFSLTQSQFLRPPPAVPRDDSHVRLWSEERTTATGAMESRLLTGPEFSALAARREIFRAVAAWTEDALIVRVDGGPARRVNGQFVTPNYLTTLGVGLAEGRGPVDAEDVAVDRSAVISHAAATEWFGSPRAAVGRRVLVNEVPVAIAGVAPPMFQGAMRLMHDPALWIPLSARTEVTGVPFRWRDDASLSVFASLAPGATTEQASAVAQQVITQAMPDSSQRVGMLRTAQVIGLHAPPPGEAGSGAVLAFTLVLLLGALVLFIACMNVSSLMVASAVARRHEIAVRLALGASRLRLIRQLVTESTVLAVTGGAMGLLLAYWMLAWMQATQLDAVDIMPDALTFTFALIVAVATGVLFGLSPALNATRGGVASAMRETGGGSSQRSRLQRGLVVAQIAASQPLLLVLGILVSEAMVDIRPLDPSMSREVISAVFDPHEGSASTTMGPAAVAALVPRIAERPEVRAVVPASAAFDVRGIFALDDAGQRRRADTSVTVMHLEGVAPGWFDVIDVPLVLGRDVAFADTAGSAPAVVIGSDLARRLYGDANPVGRQLASPALGGLTQDSLLFTVVGVFDASERLPGMLFDGEATRTNVRFRVYTAHGAHWQKDRLLIRTRGPAAAHLNGLQRFALEAAPSLPLSSMRTLEQIDEDSYAEALEISGAALVGGALALLLASLGLYGVVALAVRQRTREIGIRIAIGARPTRVALMFLWSGVRSSVIALLIGMPVSVALMRIGMATGVLIIPGVDVVMIGAIAGAVLVSVAAMATWLPARRAAVVDPAIALRSE